MSASVQLADRFHEVTQYDKSVKVGGGKVNSTYRMLVLDRKTGKSRSYSMSNHAAALQETGRLNKQPNTLAVLIGEHQPTEVT